MNSQARGAAPQARPLAALLVLALVGCAGAGGSLGPLPTSTASGAREGSGLPALQAERAALSQRSTGADPAPALLRDLGWAQLLVGEREVGLATLARARAALQRTPGRSDARALLGLALAAHDHGRTTEARALWLALLEDDSGHDPWAPAIAELAASRLVGLVTEPPGSPAEERAYLERLQRLWRERGDTHQGARPERRLTEEARQLLAALLGQLLRLQGQEAEAQAVDRERGCPAAFYGSGPHGHLPRLDLTTPFPPEDPARDPARAGYRRYNGYGCEITLSGGRAPRGVVYAVAYAQVRGSGPLPLAIETGGEPFALFVDGERLLLDEAPTRRRHLALTLTPGWHALALKVAAPEGRAQVQLVLSGARFYDGPAAQAPQPAAAPGSARLQERAQAAVPEPKTAVQRVLASLLRGQQAIHRGDSDGGEAGLEAALQTTDRFAHLFLLRAGLASEDQSRPTRLVRDQVRTLLQRALALDPLLLRARLNLANLDLSEDRAEQALERLEAVPPEQAQSYPLQLLRFRVLKVRSFALEAEAALQRARAAAPMACAPLEHLTNLRRELKDDAGARELARQLAACNPYSERYATELRHAGDLGGAARELARLQKLSPESESLQQALAEVLTAQGGAAQGQALGLWRGLVAQAPRTASYRVHLADLLAQRGEAKEAERVLREGLARNAEAAELHRAILAFGGGALMDADRLEGLAVIREFEERGKASYPGEAAVVVLDRTVTRVLHSGAKLTLTHNIIRVLTKDGADKFGEVRVPEGAEVLTLRTVKADGSTREPEDLAGKDSVSAPDLEAGDYVEFEYIDRDGESLIFPGGFLGERFFFSSADSPLHRSEYVLVTPWDLAMPLQIDARGEPPPAEVQRRGEDRVTTWRRREVPRLRPEPPVAETLLSEWSPSVRPGARVSHEAWLRLLQDRLLESLRPSAALARAAREALGTGVVQGERLAPAEILARTRRLYDFVRRSIKAGGSLFERASGTLARREGNRVGLLLALLREAQVPCELWLVRPLSTAVLEGPLPDVEAFGEPLIAVGPGQGAGGGPLLFLDPVHRHEPAGLVRPGLRGAKALRLWSSQEAPAALIQAALREPPRLVALSSDGGYGAGEEGLRDLRKVEMAVTLAADGGGEVAVTETLRGWPALEWREELERVAESEVRKEVEQRSLGFFFPGASLQELRYGPLDDDEAPLVLRYRFKAPRLSRPRAAAEGAASRTTELVVSAPFPALLSKRYVGVPQRTTPLLLRYIVPTELAAEYTLPREVTAPPRLAPKVSLSAFGSFTQEVTLPAPGKLRLTTSFRMPVQRVTPARYAELVAYAAQVDRAEDAAALLTLQPAAP